MTIPAAGAAAADAAAGESVKALVPAQQPRLNEQKSAFPAPVLRLPVDLAVSVPVHDFRVRQLLALTPGQVIETQWNHGDDLPLTAGDVEVAWSEFEVVETKLAVRITRLE
jgi:flagellar motor switch protein FliN/FliY